jgi:hypothetical protein
MRRAFAFSALVLAAGAFAGSCGVIDDVTGSDECGAERSVTLLNANTAATLFSHADFTHFLLSGKRHFNWSFLVEGICASENARAQWDMLVDSDDLPAGWEVSASYATTAATNANVTLTAEDAGFFIRKYSATTNVSMSQGSVLGRAQLAVDIEFAFVSQGDFSTDVAIAQGLSPSLHIQVSYKAARE